MSPYTRPLVRVYLLDDHDIVRQGLRDLLAPAEDIHVVGDSAHARTAAEDILRLRPDVMLLDLQLQDGSGIQVCRKVRSADDSVRAVLLTSAGDEDALVATILAGASGFVVKVAGTSDIASAIRRVGAGRSLLDTSASERARTLLRDRARAARPSLSEIELELLDHLAAGATDRELADRLNASETEIEAVVTDLALRVVTVSRPATTFLNSAGPGKHRRQV
ncbi:response regulator transcription factor [Nocardioides endophyticus]|uniref:Response regulator transcription factor n=1 Tax=Nocardioides endophyticus TaxID=1353775 RepID=A0ABP8Z1P2_9ACTN